MITIKPCCKGSCPEIQFNETVLLIKDDYGGTAKMTPEQFRDIAKAFLLMKP